MDDEKKYPLLKRYLCDDGLEWTFDSGLEYIRYRDGQQTALLDGDFSVELLEQLIRYMRDKSEQT